MSSLSQLAPPNSPSTNFLSPGAGRKTRAVAKQRTFFFSNIPRRFQDSLEAPRNVAIPRKKEDTAFLNHKLTAMTAEEVELQKAIERVLNSRSAKKLIVAGPGAGK